MRSVSGAKDLRSSIIGLLGLAAAEEQMLVASAPLDEPGDPRCWGGGGGRAQS
jgi:hypothetical protein